LCGGKVSVGRTRGAAPRLALSFQAVATYLGAIRGGLARVPMLRNVVHAWKAIEGAAPRHCARYAVPIRRFRHLFATAASRHPNSTSTTCSNSHCGRGLEDATEEQPGVA